MGEAQLECCNAYHTSQIKGTERRPMTFASKVEESIEVIRRALIEIRNQQYFLLHLKVQIKKAQMAKMES